MTTILPNPPEITPAEIVRRVEAGEPIQVMDVRAPERLATGRLDLVPEESYHNIRGSVLSTHTDLSQTGLDPDLPVVTVCGQGKDSKVIAAHLAKLGAHVASLSGGLLAWMNLVLPRPLDPPEGVDELFQFDRIGKGCLGYLLVSQGQAVLVDPPHQLDPYLQVVEELGAQIVAVADTHVHADYVSGAVPLSRRLGVPRPDACFIRIPYGKACSRR